MLSIKKFIKSIRILNSSDQTKGLEVSVSDSAVTNTKTTLLSAQTADRTIALPDSDGVLVDETSSQTLENKTIVVADNNIVTEPHSGLTATELNAALAELQDEIEAAGAPEWGDITGTLSDQTDLQTALDGKANQSLNNLTTTSINQALVPDGNSTRNLGGPSNRWNQSYHNTINTNFAAINNQAIIQSHMDLQAITTPTNPSPNYFRVYAKSDGLYKLDSAGVETPIGSGGATGNVITDNFTGDGVETEFDLSASPGAKSNVFCFISGVEQLNSSFNIIAGPKIQFSVAPPNASDIEVKYGIALDIGEPSDDTVSTVKIQDDAVTLEKLSSLVRDFLVPTATVLSYAGASAPSGYLMCDGSAVNRTTYSSLFAAIGITHGQGDGSTTFNIPDYRGRFLRGVDSGANRDPDKASRSTMAAGGNSGNNVGSTQGFANAVHSHGFTYGSGGSDVRVKINTASVGGWTTQGSVSVANTFIDPDGGNETRPVNAYVNFIIKV